MAKTAGYKWALDEPIIYPSPFITSLQSIIKNYIKRFNLLNVAEELNSFSFQNVARKTLTDEFAKCRT